MTKRERNLRPAGLLCMLLQFLLLATREVSAAEPSPSPTDPDTTEATATPTALPPGDDDPLREHLSLILGVSIGVGLCILFAIGCFIWLGVSALREYRNTRPSSYRGTASSNLTGGQSDTLPRSTLPRTADSYKEDGNHVTTAT